MLDDDEFEAKIAAELAAKDEELDEYQDEDEAARVHTLELASR
jgi:ATP-dependent DNA helicase